MAQEKILGKQLNITTVADEIAADPGAASTVAGGINLAELNDVSGSPTTGQVLTYSNSPAGWTAQAGGGVTNPMTVNLNTAGYEIITSASSVASAPDNITLRAGGMTYVGGGLYGGYINLYGGAATNGSYGGSINIAAGDSSNSGGGSVWISAGDTAVDYAGGTYIYGGASDNNNCTGGNVTLKGGQSTNVNYRGGDIVLTPGFTFAGSDPRATVRITGAGNNEQAQLVLFNSAQAAGAMVTVLATHTVDTTFVLPPIDGATGDVLTMSQGSPPETTWAPPANVMSSYTIATLPIVVEGAMIYVSDATTGPGGSPAIDTGVQCFGRGSGSPLGVWIDVLTGLAVV